jgi:hypothetical protein
MIKHAPSIEEGERGEMMASRGRDISAQRCCTAICGGSGTHAANGGGALGLGLLMLVLVLVLVLGLWRGVIVKHRKYFGRDR